MLAALTAIVLASYTSWVPFDLEVDESPRGRFGASMMYDPDGERVLLTAGVSLTEYFADTWSWDGEHWELVTAGPMAGRAYAAAAFDEARHVGFFFGGSIADDTGFPIHMADQWAFDGDVWSRVSVVTAPSARSAAAVAYDSKRKRIVLCGGLDDGGNRADVWAWDGSSWEELPNAPFAPRAGLAMAYDRERDRMVVFGGQNRDELFGDTWELAGETWTERVGSPSPVARTGHVMTYDSRRGVTLLFGGNGLLEVPGGSLTRAELADSWEWDGEAWTETTPDSGPEPRIYPAMAFDHARRRTVMFGGASDGDPRRETWEQVSARSHYSCNAAPGMLFWLAPFFLLRVGRSRRRG